MKFGKRKLNMAALRGTKAAIADANAGLPRYGGLYPSQQNTLWDQVMDPESCVNRAADFNALVLSYETAYQARRELIDNCEHDFGDRARSWGVDDRATCKHCGIAVASGGLLEIPDN